MNREEVKRILPHRAPMLMLDDVVQKNDSAVGRYTVRGDEFFLQGHFPNNPIVPGVILCEIMAQSVCVLLQDILKAGQLPVYTGLDRVRFHASVRPGDTVVTNCRIKRAKPPFYFAEGILSVGDKLCVSAEFSFAVTGA